MPGSSVTTVAAAARPIVPDRAVDRDDPAAGEDAARTGVRPDEALPGLPDLPEALADGTVSDEDAAGAVFAVGGRRPAEPLRAVDARPVRPGEAGVGSSGWASTGPPYPAGEDPSGGGLPYYKTGTLRQRPGVRYRPEGKLITAHRGVIAVPTHSVRAAFP
ncbi:hypothetical protein GCM10009840_17610 [Pseudolysinimonas kribbensis]|uniref:Uncharacterized protein n=1 Tax=Pseudolysinimonas kribbensis TaxID=433641 RepID=A0ABQ6JZU5_9MICO|nr:hypothetical protein GCM10025881_06790 [Pseudolysinimonas kribbensis]